MSVQPTVGMGATGGAGSDCYPYTIVNVISPKRIQITADDYKRIDNNGLSENQEYEYTSRPDASKITLSLRKSGRWVEVGQSDAGYNGYAIGHRRAYLDPHF